MSDIDFDELDRAVASVLAPDPKPTTPATVATLAATPVVPAPVVTDSEVTPVTVTVVTKPVVSPPAPVSGPIAVPAQSLHAQPVKPVQRGRFLDMVQSTRLSAPRPITPTVPVISAPSSNGPFVSDVVSPITTPTVTPPPAPVAAEPPLAIETPDFFAASPDDANPHKAPEVAPSPFIPDAKVEKRPLGNFPTSVVSVTPSVNDDLHQKLVAVESEDNIVDAAESPLPTMSHTFKPQEASLFEPHEKQPKPMKAPKPRPEKAPKYGKGTLIWVTVAVAVMLIGFGVGATLYFLVLQ